MERQALADIDLGNVITAIYKCKTIWASLPSAPYGQHQNKLSDLLSAYQSAGGTLSSVS
jgi:muramidase (phage lysozyme)